MLTIILITSISIICFCVWFLLRKRSEDRAPIAIVFGLVFLFTSLFTTTFCFITNSGRRSRDTRNQIQVKIDNLKQMREEALHDEELAKAYNEQANMVRTEIEEKQEKLHNPWINWFTCYVYNEFDAESI